MRIITTSIALLCLCCAMAQRTKTPAQALVGKWKYDVSTMHLELNAKGRQMLKDPKNGAKAKDFLAKFQKQLATMLKTMKLTFKSDRTMTVDAGNPDNVQTGTWSVNGQSVKVIMTNAAQQTPRMEISKDGKRIHTTYSDPNFGLGKVDLVRS
jgi:hypothetical protein